jgi:hypothetical protein
MSPELMWYHFVSHAGNMFVFVLAEEHHLRGLAAQFMKTFCNCHLFDIPVRCGPIDRKTVLQITSLPYDLL